MYIVFLIAAILVPANRTDLAELKPVEAVYLYKNGEQIVIQTDTEDRGKGKTVQQALKNLKDTTAGQIYLDTANYLLIGPGTEEYAEALKGELKASARVCGAKEEMDMKKVGGFLKVHTPEKKFGEWKAEDAIQMLGIEEDQMVLK